MERPESVSIFNVRVDRVDVAYILAFIDDVIRRKQKAIITYVNVHGLNLAYETPWFQDFLNRSDINFCDGFGISVASRLFGYGPIPRQTPPDWIPRLSALCIKSNYSMYFLGSHPGIADKAALRLQENVPDLKIAGTHHGYFDKQKESRENIAVCDMINKSKPNILWVGFGMPTQERWLKDNWDSLNVNVALTCGALFDYLSGDIKRGPRWMTDYGFEWLSRLLIEPHRLWRRYLIGNPLFFWRVFKERFRIKESPQ
jgi:N-acetylglucosaminyldiphosphoundecaprenol N-acetyl-beta-D-mannosaminyltransferase